MIYARTCGCGREVVYKSKWTWKRAIEKSSMCPSCRTSYLNTLPQRAMRKENNPAWAGFKDVPGKIYSKLKRGALQRDLSFEITIEDIQEQVEKQDFKCAYTNCVVDFYTNASVDRIDSSKGYTKENIQIVTKNINMLKRDFSHDSFLNMCKTVAEHSKTKETIC